MEFGDTSSKKPPAAYTCTEQLHIQSAKDAISPQMAPSIADDLFVLLPLLIPSTDSEPRHATKADDGISIKNTIGKAPYQ